MQSKFEKKWWKHTAKGAREGEKPKGERKLEKWVQQKHHSGFFVHKKLNLSLSLCHSDTYIRSEVVFAGSPIIF